MSMFDPTATLKDQSCKVHLGGRVVAEVAIVYDSFMVPDELAEKAIDKVASKLVQQIVDYMNSQRAN